MTPAERQAIEGLSIALDRGAEVPLGVQLAWAIRARVRDGRLYPGQRLPGLRDLAEALGINFNTVRAVYQRLEQDGLVVTQHGSGTYVSDTPRLPAVADIAASAARQAAETGVDPRDVAAALYMTAPEPTRRADAGAARRRALRSQIGALEQALADLQAKHPQITPPLRETRPEVQPRLLGLRELERQRASLVRALADAQIQIDTLKHPPAEPEPESQAEQSRAKRTAPAKRPARLRPAGRVAPART